MEAFVITDFVAGCTMQVLPSKLSLVDQCKNNLAVQELKSSPELSSLFSLSELERLRCCSDLCEAVFFLHGRSRPVPHGAVGLASVFVDGETHRARLAAREAGDRMEEVARARVSLPYPDKGVDKLVMSSNIEGPLELISLQAAWTNSKSEPLKSWWSCWTLSRKSSLQRRWRRTCGA